MPRIKRKSNRKKIVKRKIAPKSNDIHFTEDDLRNIPPHLLDKIPAGMGLKPNLASIRAMAAQRFATHFVQMPIQSAQQAQVQNMKNENDIKQQALNQTAQDRIVEMDRKKDLTKQKYQQDMEHRKQEQDLKL